MTASRRTVLAPRLLATLGLVSACAGSPMATADDEDYRLFLRYADSEVPEAQWTPT